MNKLLRVQVVVPHQLCPNPLSEIPMGCVIRQPCLISVASHPLHNRSDSADRLLGSWAIEPTSSTVSLERLPHASPSETPLDSLQGTATTSTPSQAPPSMFPSFAVSYSHSDLQVRSFMNMLGMSLLRIKTSSFLVKRRCRVTRLRARKKVTTMFPFEFSRTS